MATNQGSANIISNPSETLQGHLYACTITTWAFAATAVAVRFYTRVKIVGNTGWDDWMIVLALVCSSVYATFQMLRESSQAVLKGVTSANEDMPRQS